MKIIIAGGTGYVGSNLTKALIDQGHNITLIVRPGYELRKSTPKEIELITTDYSRPLSNIDINADTVINCVGIIREFRHRGVTFQKAHVDTVNDLIGLAKSNFIKRFIQISALGVGPESKTGYQRTKYQAEQLIENSQLDYTIFKPSIIFGPGDSFIPTFSQIFRYSNIMPVIGDGEYRLQPVHIDDLCACVSKSIEETNTFGKTYEIGGPDKLAYNDIIKIIGKAVGRPNPILFKIPVLLAQMKALLWDRFAWFPFTRDQITMLLGDNVTDDNACFDFYSITPKKFSDELPKYLK